MIDRAAVCYASCSRHCVLGIMYHVLCIVHWVGFMYYRHCTK